MATVKRPCGKRPACARIGQFFGVLRQQWAVSPPLYGVLATPPELPVATGAPVTD